MVTNPKPLLLFNNNNFKTSLTIKQKVTFSLYSKKFNKKMSKDLNRIINIVTWANNLQIREAAHQLVYDTVRYKSQELGYYFLLIMIGTTIITEFPKYFTKWQSLNTRIHLIKV